MYVRSAQSRRKEQGLPVTDRAGRTIGRLIGRTYHKLVTRPDQILRSPPGFGFDVWAIDFYVLPRVDELVVEDRVNGTTYRTTAENFIEHRIEINRGAGPQYVLPLSYWESGARRQDRPAQEAPPPPSPSPVQQGQRRLL